MQYTLGHAGGTSGEDRRTGQQRGSARSQSAQRMQTWFQHVYLETGASLRGLLHALWGDAESRGDSSRRDPSADFVLPALLLGYVACMMVFSVFVRQWATLHHDSTEMAAWGSHLALGYSKHPPFGAWIAGLWFRVLPHANGSFDLLAALMAATGLAGVWKLAGLYCDQPGQRFAMLPLMLTPAFTTWAFKYNANSILLLLWPWAAYFVMRMAQMRTLGSAVLAGAFAGLAMLGKYYSILLLATLGLALLVHPERKRLFASAAPYVAAVVALIVFAPHLWWLLDNEASTIAYAMAKTHYDPAEARATTLRALGAGLLTLLLPALFVWLSFRADFAGLRARLRAGLADPARRWVLVLAAGPFFLTALAHVVAGVRIGGDFLLPAFIAVPLAFAVLHGREFPALAVNRVTLGTGLVMGAMAVLSPVIGAVAFATSNAQLLEPRKELALAATDIWRGVAHAPLRRVAGSERHATAIAFFSPDAPFYMDGLRENAVDRGNPAVAREGLLYVCVRDDVHCAASARRLLGEAGVQRIAYSGSHSVLGYVGPMYNYELFLLPPAPRPGAP